MVHRSDAPLAAGGEPDRRTCSKHGQLQRVQRGKAVCAIVQSGGHRLAVRRRAAKHPCGCRRFPRHDPPCRRVVAVPPEGRAPDQLVRKDGGPEGGEAAIRLR
ncbi:hypothetical protein D3C75_913450 [compost metagenome]